MTPLIVGLFFLMLLAPCLFALLGEREMPVPDASPTPLEALEPDSQPAQEQKSPAVAGQTPLPSASLREEAAAALPEPTVPAEASLREVAAAEVSRVQALRALLEAGEAARAKADAAKLDMLVRSLDLADLRRMIAAAEEEAMAAQIAAAEAQLCAGRIAAARSRAAELALASQLAAERAATATEAAEITRRAAEAATRAAEAARAAHLKRQEESGEMEAATDPPGKLPDDPSMHYPRARVVRRAA